MAIPLQVVSHVGGFLLTLFAFRIYFDGLERVSSLESNLWAVSVLILGVSGLIIGSLGAVVLAGFVALLYGLRTRLV